MRGMETGFEVTKPGEIVFTLTLTADLDTWRKFKDQIDGDESPGWNVKSEITDMIVKAGAHFYPPVAP